MNESLTRNTEIRINLDIFLQEKDIFCPNKLITEVLLRVRVWYHQVSGYFGIGIYNSHINHFFDSWPCKYSSKETEKHQTSFWSCFMKIYEQPHM